MSTDALPPAEARCTNCGQRLDSADKFCRECGLPTLHRARVQAPPPSPPDTNEFKRALDAVPDPRPFLRPGITAPTGTTSETKRQETTSSVVRLTNPTFAAGMAGTTLLMVGIMVLLGLAGLVLLVLAFRP